VFPVRYALDCYILFRGTSRLNDEHEHALQHMKTSFRDDRSLLATGSECVLFSEDTSTLSRVPTYGSALHFQEHNIVL
jgi:hypothetical protein